MKNDGIDLGLAKRILSERFVAVPARLVEDAKKLGLTPSEGFLVLHLYLLELEKKGAALEKDLAERLGIGEGEILELVAGLIAKEIIAYEEQGNGYAYSLEPLYERLFGEPLAMGTPPTTVADGGHLYRSFEGEFKRPLSPIELDALSEWVDEKALPEGMILEALKVAVTAGALNFKYIDRVLMDWSQKGVSSVRENEAFEENRKQRRKKPEDGKKKTGKRKYGDIYLN